jgi:uncharacterized protein
MNWKRITITLFLGLGLPALLAGCFGTSPPARFYTLTPQDQSGTPSATPSITTVSIGPVDIPGYLDRRQIVTRSGRNEIVLDEYHRWGGVLGDEIAGLLASDLSKRLVPAGFAVAPWRSATAGDARTNYRIQVRITRFDGSLGGSVVLNASWTLSRQRDNKEEAVLATESSITVEVGGKSYEALVAAMGTAVEKLGSEMAAGVTATASKKGQGG